MKSILLICLLLTAAVVAEDYTVPSYIGELDDAFGDSSITDATSNQTVGGTWEAFTPSTNNTYTLLFWFKTAHTLSDASDTNKAQEIFCAQGTGDAADTDFICFSIDYVTADEKIYLTWDAQTTGVTADPVVSQKVALLNTTNFTEINAKWTLAWAQYVGGASATFTSGCNATDSTGSISTSTQFLNNATVSLAEAKFFTVAADAAFGGVTVDGFMQVVGTFDPETQLCEDDETALPEKYQRACGWKPATKKSSGQLLYISLFVMMIIISILF